MAKIETVWTADRKEMDDILIRAAQAELKAGAGNAKIEYDYSPGANDEVGVSGVKVTFSAKV